MTQEKQDKRRHFTSEEKVSILREHLLEKKEISDICDKHNLQPNLFYRWQKEFFEGGPTVFERKEKKERERYEAKIKALEEKLTRKNEVLSELMEEHLHLKKRVGRSDKTMDISNTKR